MPKHTSSKTRKQRLEDKKLKQDVDDYRAFFESLLPADKADLIESCNRLDPQLLFVVIGGACGTMLQLLTLDDSGSFFETLDPNASCYSCFKALHYKTHLRPKACLAEGLLPSAWINRSGAGRGNHDMLWVIERSESGLIYHKGLFPKPPR
ncbi:MAG: hypothetical protein SWY16_04450 [Cyanobacteriota bacterium]|nr:hypothetical protein [Cyanobacteriota bacterium]